MRIIGVGAAIAALSLCGNVGCSTDSVRPVSQGTAGTGGGGTAGTGGSDHTVSSTARANIWKFFDSLK